MGKRKKGDSDEDDEFIMDEEDFDDDEDFGVVELGEDDDDDDDFVGDEPPKKKAKKETSSKKAASSKKESSTKKSTTSTSKKGSTASSSSKTKKKDSAIKSEPQARELIFDYLKSKNRPFSVQNLVENLHGQVKKAMCQKCVDKLVKEGKVTLKENKKAKIYFMNQEDVPVMDKEELKQMDDQIKKLTAKLNDLKSEVNELSVQKAKYTKAMSNEEIAENIRQLEEECEKKQARLEKLKNGTQLANPEDKKKAMTSLEFYLKHWRTRKSIFKDILDKLTENIDNPSQFLEEIGLETDESLGININNMGTNI
jgi:26S proteasome regulatory subunit (ATPase 3-interacting protein)